MLRSSLARVWLLAVCLLSACGAASQPSNSSADAGDAQPADVATWSDSAADSATPDAVAVGTVISGTAHGKPFNAATSAWMIGAPDTATDTVVYLFSAPVGCGEITKAGWDGTLADGTQMLEIKLIGSALQTYPVVKTATPADGEASVNTTLVTAGQPTEGAAVSGSVTLTGYVPTANATGKFDLKFAGGEALTGTFNVGFCAAGREP